MYVRDCALVLFVKSANHSIGHVQPRASASHLHVAWWSVLTVLFVKPPFSRSRLTLSDNLRLLFSDLLCNMNGIMNGINGHASYAEKLETFRQSDAERDALGKSTRILKKGGTYMYLSLQLRA